jgi:hypothetical protein
MPMIHKKGKNVEYKQQYFVSQYGISITNLKTKNNESN